MPALPSSRRETSRRPSIAARNRPLRGFATRGEANTPSEASAELRGVKKKLFLQVVPVVSLYMFCMFYMVHCFRSRNLPVLSAENFPSAYDTAPFTTTAFTPLAN